MTHTTMKISITRDLDIDREAIMEAEAATTTIEEGTTQKAIEGVMAGKVAEAATGVIGEEAATIERAMRTIITEVAMRTIEAEVVMAAGEDIAILVRR
jgi:hypothetical protein